MSNSEDAASETEFGYPIVRCDSFDDLLSGKGSTIQPDALLEVALRKGRVLLQAPGGAGKTWTLLRLRDLALQRGQRVGYVPVHRLHQSDLERNGVDALLRASEPAMSYEELAGGGSLLLLVDGLSEVSRATASLVLDAVDQWAALGPSTGTIVADRLVRREVGPPRWVLLTLGSVNPLEAERLLGRKVEPSEVGLSGNPVYLRMMLEQPNVRLKTRGQAIQLLIDRAELTPADQRALSRFALTVYQERHRRSFDRARLEEALSERAVASLIEAGIVGEGFGQLTFRHHLIHDYLAASQAALEPENWGHDLFDALSLYNSSHDALVMLLEQASGSSRGNLIRRVYDWNLYAASYLLSRDRKSTSEADAATEHEILALLGERRFDFFLASRRQVEDALLLHGGPVAEKYLGAAHLTDVLEFASSCLRDDANYQEWLKLFLTSESPSPQSLLGDLMDADGVNGWTAANVVRRLGVDEEGFASLRDMAHNQDPVVRWRSVHALGVAGPDAIDTLFEVLADDQQTSVKFGALRSLVDQAYRATDAAMRKRVFRGLANQSALLRSVPALSAEFERVLEVADPPLGWSEDASVVLESMLAEEDDPGAQERWRRVSALLRLEWTGSGT